VFDGHVVLSVRGLLLLVGGGFLTGFPAAYGGGCTKVLGRGYRYVIGGLIFGLGWGLLGACPGPIFALIGAGVGPMVVAGLAAVAGTWVYGHLRPSLPH